MDFKRKRWISLSSGFIIEIFSGLSFAWSVFVLPLSSQLGWPMGQLSIVYACFSVAMMISTVIIAPKLRVKVQVSHCVLLGSILYGGGLCIAGFANDILVFAFSYAIMGGIGISLIYPQLMSYSVEIFPDKRGFASGFTSAGLAVGSLTWALVVNELYEKTGDISRVFIILGVIFTVAMAMLSFLIFEKPEGFEKHIERSNQKVKSTTKIVAMLYREKNRKEMLNDKLFYMIYFTVMALVFCAQMIISQCSPIMQLTFGMNASSAATIVGFFAIANFTGRLFWGSISDKLGIMRTIIMLEILMGISMGILYLLHIANAYIFALMLCAICYGGIVTVVPPITMDLFGQKNFVENFGFMFTVYGISGMIAPPLIAFMVGKYESYNMAFLVGMLFCMVGLILAFSIKKIISSLRLGVEKYD